MTGFPLILVFILAIIVMIAAISKFHIHPFLAIMTVSLILGLVVGIPLVNVTNGDKSVTQGIANVIGAGFSGTFTSIGIVIILGALVGSILEATGAAFKLADMVIGLVGKKRPELAILLMGWVVSIPVFCDSGFVILNPIRKALVKRTMTSSVGALESIGIFFPFLLAAILKTAQGSSTVAITTTAGILAPLMVVLGLDSPVRAALAVMAIGAGSMTVSHANDSYFWVVTNFGAMKPEQGYRTQTLCTLILGITSIAWIFVLSLIFR